MSSNATVVETPGRGPYYRYKGRASNDQLGEIIHRVTANRSEYRVMMAIYEISQLSGGKVLTLDDIHTHINGTSERSLSSKTIRNITNELVIRGVLVKEQIQRTKSKIGGRPPALYVLDASALASLGDLPGLRLNRRTSRLPAPSQMDLFDDAVLPRAQPNYKSVVIDDFWCQFLSSILPLSKRYTQKKINAYILYRRHKIPVEVVTRNDNQIPDISSLRVIIALLTLIEPEIRRRQRDGEAVNTRYTIDIRDLLDIMKLPNRGSRRERVLRQLQQWEDAIFRFGNISDVANNELEQRFQGQVQQFQHHQLISQLCGVSATIDGREKTVIGIELPRQLVERIADSGIFSTFRVTPNIVTEQNPLAIALHLYCRKMLGHKREHMEVSLEHLWRSIGQTMKYREFTDRLRQLIRERDYLKVDAHQLITHGFRIEGDEKNRALLHGYYLNLHESSDGASLSITIDVDDHHVGKLSLHHRLKRDKPKA